MDSSSPLLSSLPHSLPGLLCEGAPVLMHVNRPYLPEDDPAEQFVARGTILKDITEAGDPDQRWLCWFDDPRIGLDNRAAMFLELDLTKPMGRCLAALWVNKLSAQAEPSLQVTSLVVRSLFFAPMDPPSIDLLCRVALCIEQARLTALTKTA